MNRACNLLLQASKSSLLQNSTRVSEEGAFVCLMEVKVRWIKVNSLDYLSLKFVRKS